LTEPHLEGCIPKTDRKALRNPFYFGIIQIEKTSQSFIGAHKPLISKHLFDQVQSALDGNFAVERAKHDYPFRQLFSCKLCGKSLIPEKQKGHVYYRCQTKSCPTKCIRQEPIESGIVEKLMAVQLDPEQHEYLAHKLQLFRNDYWAIVSQVRASARGGPPEVFFLHSTT
jgi:hypothetical protein